MKCKVKSKLLRFYFSSGNRSIFEVKGERTQGALQPEMVYDEILVGGVTLEVCFMACRGG